MTRLEHRIREVVKVFLPRGWKLVERQFNEEIDGYAHKNTRTIYCIPLKDTYALFVFLHEVGHIRCGHMRKGHNTPLDDYTDEYEAEMWAINAMKAAGFRVTDHMLENARHNVRNAIQIEEEHNERAGVYVAVDKEILKFAYPKTWKEHLI